MAAALWRSASASTICLEDIGKVTLALRSERLITIACDPGGFSIRVKLTGSGEAAATRASTAQ